MPPKIKVTKENIISTAIELVRERGEDALNARTIASALNISTQPVFYNFKNMDELREAVLESAHKSYLGFHEAEVERGEYPPYKSFGMAYINFAKEERELFKLLFMCDRKGESAAPTSDFTTSVQMIMSANGISREKAELMHTEMWTCVHGIAAMSATSFLNIESSLISDMLTDVYQGLRARHAKEEGSK